MPVMAKTCTIPVAIKRMAEGADMIAEPTIGGQFRVMARGSRALVGVFKNEAEAKAGIAKFVGQNMRDLDGQLPFPTTGGTPLSQSPLPVQSQLTPFRKALAAFQFGPGAIATPMKRFALATEGLGKGRAFSSVYEPTQVAKERLSDAAAKTKRPGLTGLFKKEGEQTFQSAALELDRQALQFDPDQRRFMTLYNEWKTKHELVAPGALLESGMDDININKADFFSELGIADQIPSMMRRNAIIDDFLTNRQEMVDFVIPKLQIAIREKRLGQEFAEELQLLTQAAGGDNTPEALMKLMGLTAEEQTGMLALRAIIDLEEFNIPAIYRYATAPKSEPGFKTGADQIAAAMGMKAEAVALAKDRIKFLEATFKGDAELQAQVLGAQLPIFREFISAGLIPGKGFGSGARPSVRRWAAALEDLPEGSAILSRRVLSGHIDPHDLNPAVTAQRHANNMLMREHLDGPIRDALEVVGNIAKFQDERAGKILINYLHELQGIPAESFKALNQMIRTVARSFNVSVDDRVAEKFINTLNFLTYSASIPFRVGLIARNGFQTTLNVPIVGGEAWHHGMKTALGFGVDGVSRPEAMQAAMERAVKAGALVVDVVPLHGGTEAIGGVSEGLFGQMRSQYAKVGFNVRELFDMGFSAYRKPDDIGRVISFEAGRFRVNKALSVYQKSAKGEAALEALKRQGKVKTFDEVIEAEFESLIRQDRFDDAANYMGKQLADKVHFLYGNANHPSGWGGVPGKLLGQFGTFPVQYLNHVVESLSRGTVKDRVEFLAVHSAINLGIVSAGAALFDADLESWAFAPSIHYTGGPYAELLLSLNGAWSGSDAEQALARRNLQMMLPWWNRPSIFVPGSYFIADIVRSAQKDSFGEVVAQAAGVRFLEGRTDFTTEVFDKVGAGFGWLEEILP
jgi:hypothetical protein